MNNYLILAYFAGILMLFSPCIFPVLTLYISILGNKGNKLLNTISFLIGISVTFIILGYSTNLSFIYISQYLNSTLFKVFISAIIILLGLIQSELLKIDFLNKTRMLNIKESKNSIINSFLIGFSFSFAWTPCVGVILTFILTLISESSTAVKGAFLMFIFTLGFATPFVLFSIFSEKLFSKFEFIKQYLQEIKIYSGYLMIIFGIWTFFR